MITDEVRNKLVAIASRIRFARRNAMQYDDELTQLKQHVATPWADSLCDGDDSCEHIADVWMRLDSTQRKLDRNEFVELIRRLRASRSNVEYDLNVHSFKYNCVHEASTDLIFYPEPYFDGRDRPSAEEIVDKALEGGRAITP